MKGQQTVTVSQIIENLSPARLTEDQVMSNAGKAFERQEWFSAAIAENRLTDFLETVEQTINALPEGDIISKVKSPTTGIVRDKKSNLRDTAKVSLKRAFAAASKKLPEGSKWGGKELTFKLSLPIISAKVIAEKTLEDKLLLILQESIDNKGLSKIVETIATEQKRHKEELAGMAEAIRLQTIKSNLLSDVASMVQRGKSEEQAICIAAAMNDLSIEELKVAIA
jgi:hypothetical protein